jgi:sulfite reductase (ferredoxin)
VEHKPAPVTDGKTKPKPGYADWAKTNVYQQRQAEFLAVTINLPLGDITSRQSRKLADVVRKYANDALRTTVEQNFLLRWIHQQDVVALYNDLHDIKLVLSGAQTISDVTSCPGTDTCKLGIASSRGLGAELRSHLDARGAQFDDSVKNVNIRVSGCPNSCGLHHIGDIGFYGSSRNVGSYKVPHFQIMLGGSLADNAGNYGMAIGAVPSKRAPETADRLLGFYTDEKQGDETFRAWVQRVGKKNIKERIQDLMAVPSYEDDKSFYVDWHDSREYSIGDIGTGECAGEVVSLTQFSLASAEATVFDASVIIDDADEAEVQEASRLAYDAMVVAAQGLLKMRDPDVKGDPETVFTRFQKEFVDTNKFFERYVGNQEWPYFQAAHQAGGAAKDRDEARRRVEEAQLFVEASHACYTRMLTEQCVGTPADNGAPVPSGVASGNGMPA